MIESSQLRIVCPSCGSPNPLACEDRDDEGNLQSTWWECEDCGHEWRFADDELNPECGDANGYFDLAELKSKQR